MSMVYGYLNEKTRSISQSSRLIRRRTNGVSLLIEGEEEASCSFDKTQQQTALARAQAEGIAV